jgi:hypothetical protein
LIELHSVPSQPGPVGLKDIELGGISQAV